MKHVSIGSNQWHPAEDLQEVIDFIRSAAQDEPYQEDGNTLKPGAIGWSWVRNSKCKYVSLRFDMRDGAFVIQDKEGNRVYLEDLQYQYKSTP